MLALCVPLVWNGRKWAPTQLTNDSANNLLKEVTVSSTSDGALVPGSSISCVDSRGKSHLLDRSLSSFSAEKEKRDSGYNCLQASRRQPSSPLRQTSPSPLLILFQAPSLAVGLAGFAHQLLLPALSAPDQNAHWRFYASHGGLSMPKSKVLPKFSIGDRVRVRSCVCDPDYDDLKIGGWAGTVGEAEKGSPPTYLVRWNGETLRSQGSIYRKRCERDGYDGEEMWLGEDDLEPDTSQDRCSTL